MLTTYVFRQFIKVGHLTLVDASGTVHEFAGTDEPRVRIRLVRNNFFRRLQISPELAVGEGYMNGDFVIEEGTLYDFLGLCVANMRLVEKHPVQRVLGFFRQFHAAVRNHNPIRNARRKVSHHYDLKDELFDLFLDPVRQYSCAYFSQPDEDLETAQNRKMLHIAAKLLLKPGQRVLDIGSGWGGLAMFLSRLEEDVTVDGVTLSHEQHRESTARAKRAGLAERARFHLEDYRLIDRSYDRIVSVGMLEHVGPRHYDEYYGKVAQMLDKDGVAVIHSIGKFDSPGPQNAWMEKYIFPGAYTPTLSEQIPAIERAKLLVTDVEVLRIHYADTLRRWREAFYRNLDQVRTMYDDRFCRMWDFYLTGCEQAFRQGILMVFQFQLAKSMDAVPLTRDYIQDYEQTHWPSLTSHELTSREPLRQAGD